MKEFDKLVEIIATLRSPNGCEWDKQQTLDSIKPYLLEETYEVIESIMDKNYDDLREELGDLLCQVVFLSQLSNEDEKFTIAEVVEGINHKLITRHPHVFGDLKTNDTEVILKNWEKIKSEEKTKRESVLDGIPKTLPSLTKAFKTQDKAARVGFDWNEVSGALEKVEEELNELKEVIENKNEGSLEEEVGDLLFSIVNVSRFLTIDPESALHKTINKFHSRFRFIEKQLKEQNKSFDDSTLEEMDRLWDKAKELEHEGSDKVINPLRR